MRRIQLVVTHVGHRIRYYTIPPGQGWHIDPEWRQIIVGRGVPRTHIPLDNVISYSIEEIAGPEDDVGGETYGQVDT